MTTSPQNSTPPEPYVAPRAIVLGTLADVTLGHPGPKSDGINPGSLIKR
jgi:hypothetical protein